MSGYLHRLHRVAEIVGTSRTRMAAPLTGGTEGAGTTVEHLDRFSGVQIRGFIADEMGAHHRPAPELPFGPLDSSRGRTRHAPRLGPVSGRPRTGAVGARHSAGGAERGEERVR